MIRVPERWCSAMTSPANTTSTSPKGRAPYTKVSILSSQRDTMSAKRSIMANFATSEGCKRTGPSSSQRVASPSEVPIIRVSANSATVPPATMRVILPLW